MILQALCEYYEQLLEDPDAGIARPGWCSRRVGAILSISSQGELKGVIPSPEKRGWERLVPEQAKRTVGIEPNLLCDNSTYILGADSKGNPDRARRCFEASREAHLAFLDSVESPAAQAVARFFEGWDPSEAMERLASVADGGAVEKALSGGNLVFAVDGEEALDDPSIRSAWERRYRSSSEGSAEMVCLVTGERVPIERLHPAIKGVAGAQSMGASLVGFNAPAFESYGHDGEQGLNAPVGKWATFAYTTALNHLLGDRRHHMRIGDTTVVYWANRNDGACSSLYTELFGGFAEAEDGDSGSVDLDAEIDGVMRKIRSGLSIEGVDLGETFYVLGLAPNAARLSVRFFQRSAFGDVLRNIGEHYDRIDITRGGSSSGRRYLTPYMLLKEVENPKASKPVAMSLLGGALMRSILNNADYPEALFANAMLRTKATQDDKDKRIYKVTRGRAAIVKAYLIKNRKKSKEEVTVSVNESRRDAPYVLGRLFSVLESIQSAANPGINSTIKDKYFNSACATPSVVFPTILSLSERHLAKVRREAPGLAGFFEKERLGLIDAVEDFPKRLSLDDQGTFMLGYYHQTQKRFEKKDAANNETKEA